MVVPTQHQHSAIPITKIVGCSTTAQRLDTDDASRTPSHLTFRLLHKSHAAITRSSLRRFSGCAAATSELIDFKFCQFVGSEGQEKVSEAKSHRRTTPPPQQNHSVASEDKQVSWHPGSLLSSGLPRHKESARRRADALVTCAQ